MWASEETACLQTSHIWNLNSERLSNTLEIKMTIIRKVWKRMCWGRRASLRYHQCLISTQSGTISNHHLTVKAVKINPADSHITFVRKIRVLKMFHPIINHIVSNIIKVQGESKKRGISKSMYIALRAIKIKQIKF